MQGTSWRLLLLTCLLVVPVLLLAVACGGDDEATTEPEATTPSGAAAPTTAATTEEEPAEPEDTPVPASPENPFVIGAMDALTGVGESYGIPLQQAKLLAVEQINAEGGINGRELQIIFEDSKCAAQDAITAYRKLTDTDNVKIILGTTCSGAMLGAAPLAEAEGVVMLSASATSPDIAGAGEYIFRTAINDLQLGVDTGNAMWADGVRSIATITESTDYAEGARRTSVAQFEKLGGTVVASEAYASETIDFRTQLTKLINTQPGAILLSAQGEVSGGTIVKQARELAYLGPIYSEIVPTAPDALGIAGEAATGLKAIVPNPDLSSATGKDFLAAFKARYGVVAPLPWFMGSAYDDVYIAAECIGQTGDDQDTDGFRDCLNEGTFSGVIGDNYSFDENGDVAGLTNVVIEVLPLADRTEENLGYLVLGPAPSEAAAMAAAAGEPFVIGVMESVTGPGETYGNVAVQAKQMAVDEINASGGINGRKLELIVEDSKCAAQDAITAYNKLTGVDGVRIILGTSCSGAMLGAAPLAEADGVVMFSGLANQPGHRQRGRLHLPDVDERPATGHRHGQRNVGRRRPLGGDHHRGHGLRRGCSPDHGGAVHQPWRVGDCRGALCVRHHRLQDAANQADERQPRRHSHRVSIGVHRGDHHQAARRAGIRRPDLLRDCAGGRHGAGDCRGRRDRREGCPGRH